MVWSTGTMILNGAVQVSPPEPVDGHVRFAVRWCAIDRYIFVSEDLLAYDAGRELSKYQAVAYVRRNLTRLTAIAMHLAQDGPAELSAIVRISRIDDLALA